MSSTSATSCSFDPVPCIEGLFTAIGDLLKDGRTMAVLALLLVVLWRTRSRQRQAAKDAYQQSMLGYAHRNARRPSASGRP